MAKRRVVKIVLDEDGVSEDDAQYLYLLTKKAISSGYTEKQCHQTAAIQPARIWKALQEEGTLAKLRKTIISQYEEEAGVKVDLDLDSLLAHLESLMVPDEL